MSKLKYEILDGCLLFWGRRQIIGRTVVLATNDAAFASFVKEAQRRVIQNR